MAQHVFWMLWLRVSICPIKRFWFCFEIMYNRTMKNIEDNQNSVLDDELDNPSTTTYQHVDHEGLDAPSATTDQEEDNDGEEEIPPLTYKEMRALKRSKYAEVANKFKKIFLLKNKRTGQIVEIRAASAFHACNFIGWKPNRVKVLEQREEKVVEDESKGSSDNSDKEISSHQSYSIGSSKDEQKQ